MAPAVLPITGYLDRLSARPGERLAVKVSAQVSDQGGGHYEAEVLRIRLADPNPAGPGLKYELQPGLGGRFPARHQESRPGSYARIPAHPCQRGPRLVASLLVQPWLLRLEPSTLVAGGGWRLEATKDALRLIVDGEQLVLPLALRRRQWYRLWLGLDAAEGRLLLGCATLAGDILGVTQGQGRVTLAAEGLTLAAHLAAEGPTDFFNGRLEDPALHDAWPGEQPPPAPDSGQQGLVAWWDFSHGIETQEIVDQGPFRLRGTLVNVPTRAVCGARWSGNEMAWRHAPRDYAAIHFHEDDLYDCGWESDFELEIPAGTKSGVYGLRLRLQGAEDILPFYVLAPRGRPQAKVCFLASSFTYQAYGNHARGNFAGPLSDRVKAWGAAPYNPDDYPTYGRSTYNYHPDRTGHAFSSRLRPLLTVRPNYVTFPDAHGSGLRHFSADTHLLDWLEAKGIAYDVVTDEDLDDEGVDLIRGYATVLTGSHPEYHTLGTLDALEAYTACGGKLVYLGGNGFYWRIVRSASLPGMIELRRAEGGIRAWAAEPGESYHQLDGSYGGLWRRNGRPPQRLCGVGFSAQGLFEGAWYRRLPASEKAEVAWIFAGVTEEKLGDYGLSGGGAAGFELDRADVELGTPPEAVVLARSEGHSSTFIVVPEELLSHIRTVSGEKPADLIRGELVYFERPGGGAVFSVGSITFCGSLSHNGYANGISRLLENVVRRFAGL
jgi:N,N-dimethylformamidase